MGEHGLATEGQADVGAVAFGFHVGLPAGDNQGALDVALISNLEKESKQTQRLSMTMVAVGLGLRSKAK